jgi:transposase-like protein
MSPMLLQIKECLSRNLDAVDIAHRLHVSIDYVNQAIEILNQTI